MFDLNLNIKIHVHNNTINSSTELTGKAKLQAKGETATTTSTLLLSMATWISEIVESKPVQSLIKFGIGLFLTSGRSPPIL